MLNIIGDPIFVNKGNTIDGVSGDSEIGKTISNNVIIPKSLVKSKLLVEPRFKLGFLISRTRLAFIKLRQAFIEAPILHHFDLECHIWIETDISSYAISKVLSSIVDFEQFGLVAPGCFFLRENDSNKDSIYDSCQ